MGRGIMFTLFIIAISAGLSASEPQCFAKSTGDKTMECANGNFVKTDQSFSGCVDQGSRRVRCPLNTFPCNSKANSKEFSCWADCTHHGGVKDCFKECSENDVNLINWIENQSKGSTNVKGLGVEAVPGTNNYVEYYPGNMNLILSAPHGGYVEPLDFPSREDDDKSGKWGGLSTKRDSYTREIAMAVVKHMENCTGRRPHLVLNNLHRSRLDPNRDENVGTGGRDEAETAFREYHGFIDQAMLAAVPPQLKISSSGAGSTVQHKTMGDYYLSVKRYKDFPVYIKVDNSQVVFVDENGNWVVFSLITGNLEPHNFKWAFGKLDPKDGSLRNKESGGASPSPPVRGWEYWDSGKSRWVSDHHMKVESIAPPYVTVSSTGAAASEQPARMGTYHSTNETYNNYPVYKKEDNSQVMFVNDKKEWVVSSTIKPKKGSLKNKGSLTTTPPRDGWQFWNRDNKRWIDDSKLRVDPPSALLLDIHGQTHGKNSTELGYRLKRAQLNEESYNADETSIWGLIERTGIPVDQMLHGNKSLGAMFNDAGYKAVPSRDQETPGKDTYWNGGYTIGTHGSIYGGPMDAIQAECPAELRRSKNKGIRDRFIKALARIFERFYVQFYDN